ncbi:rhomboid family intramembrane serine protease [Azonexus sp. IMCC34839]|uniref:rhomboid family intramembrane serine protease n=1 Tax=Azonexus sp. IMCC34839 TaxID=3133695 RepID=UPI003999BC86
MDPLLATLPAKETEHFCASRRSKTGKVRRWLWVGGIFAFLITLLTSRGRPGVALMSAIFCLVVFGGLDLMLRRRMRLGEPLITLDQHGIWSSLFPGDNKQYEWAAIESVSLSVVNNVRLLQLNLHPTPDLPNRSSFWTGRNAARPALQLDLFDEATQQGIFSAIDRRLQAQGSRTSGQRFLDEVAEEKAFQEQLKSFATPWLTWLLVGLNVVIWLWTVQHGGSAMGSPAEKLLVWGGNAASEVQKGDWWRLLSATFLHSGLMHVLMNMIGLVAAGVTVERIYGHRQFALIYFGSGLMGSALSLHFAAQQAVSVGASGAVFGVTGALLVGILQHRDKLPPSFGKQTVSSLGIFIVYALLQGFTKPGIDNAAHIGGLIGGCALAYLLPERFDMEHFLRTRKSRALAGLAAVLLATSGLAAMAPHARIDQKLRFTANTAFAEAMTSFKAAFAALQKEQDDIKAGRMSEREADDRSRSVHAPVFRKLQAQFEAIELPNGDPRQPLLDDTRRLIALMLESLAMESVYAEGSDKPEPADPVRMQAIQRELEQVGQRLQRMAEANKAARK